MIDLEGPAPNLKDSIDQMMATMENMKLGSTASGVEAPSLPEGVKKYVNIPSGKYIYVHKYVYICVYTYLCKMDEYRSYAGLS